MWLAGGGDATFGGSPKNPSTAGIVILKNASTWNSGIVIMRDALTSGDAISMSSAGVGGAHRVSWTGSDGSKSLEIYSEVTTAETTRITHDANGLNISRGGNAQFIVGGDAVSDNRLTVYTKTGSNKPILAADGTSADIGIEIRGKGTGEVAVTSPFSTTTGLWKQGNTSSGVTVSRDSKNVFRVTADASHQCGINLYAGSPGSGINFAAEGLDTNIDVQFTPKGTGLVRYGTHTANPDAPITGFILIKDAAGNQRKLAVIT